MSAWNRFTQQHADIPLGEASAYFIRLRGHTKHAEQGADLREYLAAEQQGAAAQEKASEEFYRQRFQEAAQQLQDLQQQTGKQEQQVEQLQGQLQQAQQAQQQALMQAQQVQEAALQNAQSAQMAAAQAMQRTLATSNELLQQQQISAEVRDAAQAMRSSLMEIVQQPMPPATTAEAQQAAAMEDPMAQTQDPQMAEAGAQPVEGQGQPVGAQQLKQASRELPPELRRQYAHAFHEGLKKRLGQDKTANARVVGALVGASLGAGGVAVEAHRPNDALRAKKVALEARDRAGGGFANAMNLAQVRMRLAANELAERHPVGATAFGAAAGAMMGAGAGPHAKEILDAVRDAKLAASLSEAKGFRRAVQLLTGSRHRALRRASSLGRTNKRLEKVLTGGSRDSRAVDTITAQLQGSVPVLHPDHLRREGSRRATADYHRRLRLKDKVLDQERRRELAAIKEGDKVFRTRLLTGAAVAGGVGVSSAATAFGGRKRRKP